MMGDIAAMGGELFVMDDGWFGDKYPRKNYSYALGDWTVDKTKLPGGCLLYTSSGAKPIRTSSRFAFPTSRRYLKSPILMPCST